MKLGSMSAMDVEMEMYLDRCGGDRVTNQAGLTFSDGRWHGHELVLVRAGVGKVNAALCAQMLIDKFGVGAIICTGVAGALNPELEIGDIVVAEDCVQHDVLVDFLGIPRGQIPFTSERFFETSPELRRRAATISLPGRAIRRGRVLTGDMFIEDEERRRRLRDELGGDCVDMESAAVGQVCAMNDVPYLVVRAISDHADGTSGVDFETFLQDAADASSELVLRLLEQIDPEDIVDGLT